jgi:hypothetical protein
VLGVDGSVDVADGLKELGSSRSTCCARIPPFLLVGASTNGGWWRGFSVMGPRLRPSELGSSKAESRSLPEALGDSNIFATTKYDLEKFFVARIRPCAFLSSRTGCPLSTEFRRHGIPHVFCTSAKFHSQNVAEFRILLEKFRMLTEVKKNTSVDTLLPELDFTGTIVSHTTGKCLSILWDRISD